MGLVRHTIERRGDKPPALGSDAITRGRATRLAVPGLEANGP